MNRLHPQALQFRAGLILRSLKIVHLKTLIGSSPNAFENQTDGNLERRANHTVLEHK